jgi:hypothetical protein
MTHGHAHPDAVTLIGVTVTAASRQARPGTLQEASGGGQDKAVHTAVATTTHPWGPAPTSAAGSWWCRQQCPCWPGGTYAAGPQQLDNGTRIRSWICLEGEGGAGFAGHDKHTGDHTTSLHRSTRTILESMGWRCLLPPVTRKPGEQEVPTLTPLFPF